MGWQADAPSFPSGSSWVSVGSGGATTSNYKAEIQVHVARMTTNQVCIRFKLTSSEGTSGNFYYPGYVNFSVGNSTKNYGWARSLTRYWTGSLDAGAKIAVKAGGSNSTTSYDHATYIQDKKATGPAYLAPVYTIAYYSNNGAGSTTTQSKTWGYAVNLYSCGWTKAGHTFVRWNTAADGSGTGYNAGQSYSANEGRTLYAIWSPNTFAVSYNANGGSGTTENQTKTYGQDLTLQANGFTPPAGHHFAEWNTASDRSGTSYAAGGTYTANAAATLYAIWEPDTYTVSFHPNGADGGAQEPQTKTYGARLVIAGCGYTRTGYSFAEWNTAADGTGTSYPAGSYYETNEPVTLYAIWTKNNIPVYLNDDGTIRQAVKAYMNIGGTVYEGTLYMNIGGTIYEIG